MQLFYCSRKPNEDREHVPQLNRKGKGKLMSAVLRTCVLGRTGVGVTSH
jgi:hypothetical protein